jgi:predicted aspartyl protease
MTALLLLLPPQAPTAESVLASVRAAVGFAAVERAVAVEATGRTLVSGVEGDFHLVFDPQGRYVFSQGGALGQTRGWDGKAGWEADAHGATAGIHLSDLQQQHAISWVVTHEWLDPKGPVVATLAETEPGADSYTLNLRQREGVQTQTVVVDAKTWLPAKNSFSIGELDYRMEFADWRDAGGFKLPYQIDTYEGDLKGWIKLSSVKPLREQPPFARPYWSVTKDTTYDTAKQGVVESKRVFTGHIIVHPTVQGKDVGWFLLDSGAGGMVIDPKVAEELGAKKFGELNVGGVGGVTQSGFYTVKGFSLGPATVGEMNFIGLDLSQIGMIFGEKIAGIVGFDFFRRATVEVDLVDGRVAVYSPHAYGNSRAKWERLVLDGRHPTIPAEFEGHKGQFRLDTGANGTVTFNAPTVERLKLLEERQVRDTGLAGVGGMIWVKTGKLKYFLLGGKRFEEIETTFATEKQGIFGMDFLAGNIGQDLLKPFRVVLDYPNERLALVLRPEGSSTPVKAP